MTLYSRPIKWIAYKRFRFRLKTSYRAVLKCYEVFSDELLNDYEKIDTCLSLLVKPGLLLRFLNPDKKIELFHRIFKEFIDVSGKKADNKKYFDFKQDAGFIFSSFWQCYRIDLMKHHSRLHWWEFIALFNGLSDDTKIMQIIAIRSRPLPKPTKYNAEERRQLIRLKQLYQLEVSEKERKEQFQKGLAEIASALITLAGGAKK